MPHHLIALILFLLLIASLPCSALAQNPEIYVQTGHNSAVHSVAFSPDGRTIASSSGDQTIKLWDVATGRELRTLISHSSTVYSVAFHPGGKILASGSLDKTIKLWDVATGHELVTLTGHGDGVYSVTFSPDGQTLASGSWDRTIKLWDVATARELRTLKGHRHFVWSIAFSPNGQTLASGSADDRIKLWDIATGRELRTLAGHSDSTSSVTFSPDGQILASSGWDNMVKLWDVATGRELRILSAHRDKVTAVAFSPDGKTLASSSQDKSLKLWEVATGLELQSFTGHINDLNSVAFSPDGRIIASGSNDSTIKLWDVATRLVLRTLTGRSKGVNTLALSPDGRTLASSSYDDIKLWDMVTGRELRTITAHKDYQISLVVFSPDARILASCGGFDGLVKLWDARTGREIRRLVRHSRGLSVASMAFSLDGQKLVSGSWDGTIKLWNVATGRIIRTMVTPKNRLVDSVAFSPNGRTIASGSFDFINMWDVATGRRLHTLTGHKWIIGSLVFSPDGKVLISGSYDDTIKVWDVATGRELRTLTGHKGLVESVVFSPDGRMLASGSWDNTIKLWDVATGRELRTLAGHDYYVTSVTFSPDGKMLVSGSWDATQRLWDVASGQELAKLIAVNKSDWLVATPSGLLDGSPTAWKQILWRFGNNTFNYSPVEAYFNDFYYPGLLQDIMRGKNPAPPGGKDLSKTDRRRPMVSITLAEPEADLDAIVQARSVRVSIVVTENTEKPELERHPLTSGAQDVRIFRNGSLVKVWRGDVMQGKQNVRLEASVSITAGDNELTVYAFNHDNVKSEDSTLTVKGAMSLRRSAILYLVVAGLNNYANPAFDLKYAVADARSVAGEIKRQQMRLRQFSRVEVVALFDTQATKPAILRALTTLHSKVQPEDTVLIHFSGHGLANAPRFYLIPHDWGYQGPRTKDSLTPKLDEIYSNSISDVELESALEGLDAGQVFFIIDSCNSGQALEAEEKRRGPMNSKGLAQLAYEKGMYILTAAQSYQAALEAQRFKHGYLTYALVEEGLKLGQSDEEPKDGIILAREWFNYATHRVPAMQEERISAEKLGEKEIVFVEGDEQVRDRSQRQMQTPRVFYRREVESKPLVVARTRAARR